MSLPLPEHFQSLSHEQQLVYYRTQAERAHATAERRKHTIERMKKAREPRPSPRPAPQTAPAPSKVQVEVLAHVLPEALARLHAISSAVAGQLNELDSSPSPSVPIPSP